MFSIIPFYSKVVRIVIAHVLKFQLKFRAKFSNKFLRPDEMSSNEEQIIFEPQAKRISIKGLIYLALKERVRETKRERVRA